MKLLEVDRSATIAWSPIPSAPSLMAAGTVAGTMGLDFDTSAHLEIFSFDLTKSQQENTTDNNTSDATTSKTNAGKDIKIAGKTSAADRFHKVCWGLTGVQVIYLIIYLHNDSSNKTIPCT